MQIQKVILPALPVAQKFTSQMTIQTPSTNAAVVKLNTHFTLADGGEIIVAGPGTTSDYIFTGTAGDLVILLTN